MIAHSSGREIDMARTGTYHRSMNPANSSVRACSRAVVR